MAYSRRRPVRSILEASTVDFDGTRLQNGTAAVESVTPLDHDGEMSFSIDCATCVRQHTNTCDDCVVMFISSRQPDEAVVIDVHEFAALRRLQAAGMVPESKHQAKLG